MKVKLEKKTCIVTREDGDKRMSTESQLLYHVKLELQKQGHDVIKKRMWKDGHMVSDHCQYVRERKGKFGIWDEQYPIRDIVEDFRKVGRVVLSVAELDPTQKR